MVIAHSHINFVFYIIAAPFASFNVSAHTLEPEEGLSGIRFLAGRCIATAPLWGSEYFLNTTLSFPFPML